MKKTIALLLAVVLCFGLAACGGNSKTETPAAASATAAPAAEAPAAEAPAAEAPAAEPAAETKTVKAGFIFLHDENSTYDLNFINAAK